MIHEESLMGIERPDPTSLKPLKLHLPLEYVLALHRMRIVGARSVSEIVAAALEDYFQGLRQERAQEAVLRA